MLFSATINRICAVSDESEKSKGGRPSKFRPEFVSVIKKLSELGATQAEIAEALDVAISTVKLWGVKHEEVAEAMRVGRDAADDRVVSALYSRALGYSHEDIDIRVANGEIVETPIIKHYPPDPTSMIFWLKNRRPDKWRNQPEPDDDDNRADPLTINIQVAEPKADIKVTRGKSGD